MHYHPPSYRACPSAVHVVQTVFFRAADILHLCLCRIAAHMPAFRGTDLAMHA